MVLGMHYVYLSINVFDIFIGVSMFTCKQKIIVR